VLFEGRSPAFSPDGKRIVFVRKMGNFDQIMTSAAVGGEVQQLTTDSTNHRAPKFAPNGRYVVYASNSGFEKYAAQGGTADTSWNIHAVRIDGSNAIALTEGRFTSVQPFWAKDARIFFASNAPGNFDVFVLTPTGDMARP
jgi:Tol biopolymer transport system component